MSACYYGFLDMIKLLIEFNVNFDSIDSNGRLAWQIAQEMHHFDCVELILSEMGKKFDLNHKCFSLIGSTTKENKASITADQYKYLQDALFNNDHEKASNCLSNLKQKAKFLLNSTEAASQTYLYRASRSGNTKMVSLLLENGAIARPHCYTKYSPLYVACHIGTNEIVSLLLNQFPHLSNLSTIENFLPIHAACSQGHLEIVKLLMEHEYPDELINIYDDLTNNLTLYLFAFDLNSRDINDLSILHSAVNSGKIEICKYLLNFKVKSYEKQYFLKFNVKKQRKYRLDRFISEYKKNTIKLGENQSFYDALYSFLNDEKPNESDSVIVKYTKEDNIEENEELKLQLLNPIYINFYSKFGLTCLHDAIRQGNIELVKLLVEHGADINLPIETSDKKIISNSLVEAIKRKHEGILKYLLINENLNKETLNLAFKFCLDMINSSNQQQITLGFHYFNALLTKIQLQKDSEAKVLHKLASNKYFQRVSDFGFILSMNEFSSSLKFFYESWLFTICKTNQQASFSSITRVELSKNSLQEIPFCLFELENLRVLKLDGNKIRDLPVKKSNYDDLTLKNSFKDDYRCHLLEEIDLSNNLLVELTPKLFGLKSLKHLNVSKNELTKLPFELWSCFSLVELNVSFNRLTSLPLNQRKTADNSKNKLNKLEKTENTEEINLPYEEKPVLKVNIWNHHVSNDDNLINDEFDRTKKSEFESNLIDLNLSNNYFTQIPSFLACLAPKLLKLNLSSNLLKSIGIVTDYPKNIKFIDLSNNQIDIQMDLLNKDVFESVLNKDELCYLTSSNNRLSAQTLTTSSSRRSKNNEKLQQIKIRSRSYSRNPLNRLRLGETKIDINDSQDDLDSEKLQFFIDKLCNHRNHTKLDNLKTLNLASNRLEKLDLIYKVKKSIKNIDNKNDTSSSESDYSSKSPKKSTKPKEKYIKLLLFPNLTHLDISSNLIQKIDRNFSKLNNISYLNASNNEILQKISNKICLLTKLWNLDLKNCPNISDQVLANLILKQKTKTSDILGYLKSIFENSKTYNKIKLMVLGAQGVGKTSLVCKLTGSQQKTSELLNIQEWSYESKQPLNTRIDQNVYFLAADGTAKNFGSVTYRIWDFARYEPSYQYFLNKRALYLVCWKLNEEEKGVNELHDILLSIQTRAPKSSVILVATHYDQSAKLKNYKEISNFLQRIIFERYIRPSENENSPYPQILASIEISSKTSHNLKQLANLIYEVSCQMKVPGTKDQLLLEQKIPVSYIALESCINLIATNLKRQNRQPLLNKQDYLKEVKSQIQLLDKNLKQKRDKFEIRFRNDVEILLATQFLHDNGILIHYTDSCLQNYFIVDHQWLLNILSSCLTINKPIISLDELKTIAIGNLENQILLGLLEKCELGLTWDNVNLLIASLLPTEALCNIVGQDIRVKFSESSNNSVELGEETKVFRRIHCILFIPKGFIYRLIVRILSDSILRSCLSEQSALIQIDWKLWQTGLELRFNDQVILHVKELLNDPLMTKSNDIFISNSVLYADCENELKLKDSRQCSFIETCIFERSLLKSRILVKMFSQINEIIDSLLEDYYPDLGTRFMQDSTGDYLVTRLSPCNKCIQKACEASQDPKVTYDNDEWNIVGIDKKLKTATLLEETMENSQISERLKDFSNISWIYCFMIDDVCFSVFRQVDLNCPKHGNQQAIDIAPDICFYDIDRSLIITQNNLYFDRLLGRGSFGAVYNGVITSPINKNDKIKVAVKALENLNIEKKSDLNLRKSIRLATKAYSIARQEILILLNLKHENIVSVIGFSLMPLSIILELALLGNLTEVLNEYKKSLTFLKFSLVQQVSIQISSALSYLHSQLIIYRDLKSENILVWKFPKPNRHDFVNETLVKLADFSISRACLPTGTKGFAGTEGFMAPEIVCFNGEESYTEKIDSFSFGMLLYELISLKHPFEGKEQIKELVLNGIRPSISTFESLYPSLMLDLMCLCWSESPGDRPSASEIHQITSSFEFSHLLDVNVLQDYESLPLAIQQTKKESIADNVIVDLVNLWVVKNSMDDSKFEILTYENSLNCTTRKQMNISSERIDAICSFKQQIWCIDSMKCIYVFCSQTYTKINQYLLAISLKSEIISMLSIESIDKIILCAKGGLIVVIDAHFESIDDDLNFSTFHVPIKIYCSAAVPIKHDSE